MRLHVLASGSSGNSILVEAGEGSLLVDCGVSGAEAVRRLESVGCHPEMIRAILVSHEHTDHIQGVGAFARRFDLPVYLTRGAREACNGRLRDGVDVRFFETDRPFEIGGMKVRPFPVPHDAADPVGFTFHHGGIKAGVATDLGFSTLLARQHLSACNLLVLEANHDPELLMGGSYPWELKRRIRGRRGHLSNVESGGLLERIVHRDLEAVVLVHLSESNNRPDLARAAAEEVLDRCRLKGTVQLEVAGRRETLTVSAKRRRAKAHVQLELHAGDEGAGR